MFKTWLACILLSIIMIVIHSQQLPDAWDKDTLYYSPAISPGQESSMANDANSPKDPVRENVLSAQPTNCLHEYHTLAPSSKPTCRSHPNRESHEQVVNGFEIPSTPYP